MPLFRFIVFICAWGAAFAVSASSAAIPAGPQIAARSYVLMDFHSGQILQEKNAHERVEPASLTKLMTAYIVFSELKNGRIKLTDTTRVSEKAWRMGGSRMYIEVNTDVSVEALLKGMIIQSGNDASVALAEMLAGSEETFADMMNQYAKRLGLNNSHFENSTGMPGEQHYTTAHDMAYMAAAIIRDFPDYYKLYSEREYTYNNITQNNRNTLLWSDNSVDGMKTGYTEKAGYCLVSSAQREEMRLISVVMGTENQKARTTESQKLLTYGFRFFETHKVIDAHKALATPRIWQGEEKHLPVGLTQDLRITVPRGQYQNLKSMLELSPQLTAPMAVGAIVGKVKITLGDKLIAEAPVSALQTVEKGAWYQQLLDMLLVKF
jgi:serine-type D-Ala-D-Ala carboxypeptidase (penicillin-binding protein 5/6)